MKIKIPGSYLKSEATEGLIPGT